MSSYRALRRIALLTGLSAAVAGGFPVSNGARAQEEAPAAPEAETPAPRPRKAGPRKAAPKPVPAAPAPAPAAAPPAAAAAPAAPAHGTWPEGASTISESYGDWSVNCARDTAASAPVTTCIVVQSQGDAKTGRRKFAIELRAPKDGRAEGVIMMPFGLAIEPGVKFKLDEADLGKGAPYNVCGTDGCFVPISLPTLATDSMKTAKNLIVQGQRPGGTEPVAITVPLQGFAPAFGRAIGLTG